MKRLSFWLLLALLAADAFAGPFTIDKFEGEDVGDPDTYIAAEFSNQLKKANPNQIQDGRFYVRQKFEDPFGEDASTYQLYEGRPTAARAKLGKFSLPEVSYSQLLKAKFFLNRGASGDDDIEKVYFDGKSVFVEGEDPIFASIDGKMQELQPSVEREYPVSLTSQPAGAAVSLAGESKGVTPLTLTLNTTRPVVLTLSKSGYYTALKLLKATPGKTLQEGVLLTPKKDLENPVNALRAKLLEGKKKDDKKALEALKNTVQSKLDNWSSESAKSIDVILAKYPPNPAKSGDETPDEFNARKTVWEEERNKEKSNLESAASSYEAAMQDLIKEIEAAIAGDPFSLRYIYIPNSSLSFGKMGVKDFEVSVSNSSDELTFNYDKAKVAYGSISKSELTADQSKVHAVAKVWNTAGSYGKYNAFHDIAFFYDEAPLSLLAKGKFSSSDADDAANQLAADNNKKLTSLPNRAAWNSNDQAATLAALQKGASPAPVVEEVAAVPAPEADTASEDSDSSAYSAEADQDQLASTVAESEEDDESADDAEYDVTDRFGNTDEYIRWAAWGMAGVAVVTGVIGVLEHQKYSDAKSAYDNTESEIALIKEDIRKACNSDVDCEKAAIYYASLPEFKNDNGEAANPLYVLNTWQTKNKSTMDSYNSSRILWLSLSAASIAGSVVLFTW